MMNTFFGTLLLNGFASFVILFAISPAQAQVAGCRDPLATNYNPLATVNNGSCLYNTTSYTPVLKVDPLADVLLETSGLQMAGNYLWTFNDGGGAASIYRIDTITNAILQTVNLAGAVNGDWEDIAFDGTDFYIGDFGNNVNGARTDLKIYKFPLSAIADYTTNPISTVPAGDISTINFYYSNQPQPPVPETKANNTRFDCAAMIVDGNKIHLFTKNWLDTTTTHYEINGINPGNYIATPIETLDTKYLVTAADKAVGQNTIALLGYKNAGFANHYLHLLTDYSGANYFNGNKRKIDLPNVLTMGQAEGITFRNAFYGYISNEKLALASVTQKLKSFDISSYVSAITTTYIFNGSGNWDNIANWSNGVMPPATLTAGSEIIIEPSPGGNCTLNVFYKVTPGAKLTVNPATNFIVNGNLLLK